MVRNICATLVPFMQKTSTLAVHPMIRVLAALYFFATGSYQRTIGQSWNLSIFQPVVCRCIMEVTGLIEEHLAPNWITFPTTLQQINEIKAIIAPRQEEHNYVNRKGYHSKNVQIICNYDLKILNINSRFPGSNHDSYIWRNSNICEEL